MIWPVLYKHNKHGILGMFFLKSLMLIPGCIYLMAKIITKYLFYTLIYILKYNLFNKQLILKRDTFRMYSTTCTVVLKSDVRTRKIGFFN